MGYLPVKSQQEGKSWLAGRALKEARLLRAPGQPEEEGVGSLEKRVETETGSIASGRRQHSDRRG